MTVCMCEVMSDEDDEVDPAAFDRLILQVFEEQEERCGSLRYPLSTQRHALDFIKLMNRKGFPYVLMCQVIDEKQERFRSWRLGNGNTHIGVVMMKRINRTVQVNNGSSYKAWDKNHGASSSLQEAQRRIERKCDDAPNTH